MPYRPIPEGEARRQAAVARRTAALSAALDNPARPAPRAVSNEEERRYADTLPTSFRKGLPHNEFGMVDPAVYATFRDALTAPDYDFDVPLGPPGCLPPTIKKKPRQWESPLGGHYYDLEGPDADGVAMPPAPRLGSGELVAEMAELYAMALLRDACFSEFTNGDDPTGQSAGTVTEVLTALNKIDWFKTPAAAPQEERRRRARLDQNGQLTNKVLFRGSTAGAKVGPYISQFMYWGTPGRQKPSQTGAANHTDGPDPACHQNTHHDGLDGYIVFGAQSIDQRIYPHTRKQDHMTTWSDWLAVQNGADVRDQNTFEAHREFICTPRDLATYVHYDQLYQAYFNACLIMLENGVPFDRGFPNAVHPTRGAFATFGGPHLLSLFTKVASRALKAVRRQKFQIHRRGRPEALAAMMTLADSERKLEPTMQRLGNAQAPLEHMIDAMQDILALVNKRNGPVGGAMKGKNYLLPMAFTEGSPMHASYGAGHATVAGACVTILKAFFDLQGKTMAQVFGNTYGTHAREARRPENSRARLCASTTPLSALTVEGELDKLAANIAIGRDMAGVHFYTDYYESLRMGERVAVGMLHEQMLSYTEPVSMTFTDFDGNTIRIATDGGDRPDSATICVNGSFDDPAVADWWLYNLR